MYALTCVHIDCIPAILTALSLTTEQRELEGVTSGTAELLVHNASGDSDWLLYAHISARHT